ncbi:hypothetical protein LSH36_354g01031 [Paralvinella palmiformis]|uniref:Uncharacterized protein n=1 Tax=Paralvinella palmiformis TaxID=53620 RepID=A0AAD9JEZ0_9ANNE|nr:hypothetical protein LSH36_354g01031 [Paralvinella palmiformis]
MVYPKELIKKAIKIQNIYCLLSGLVILMCALGLTIVVIYCGSHRTNPADSADGSKQSIASSQSSLSVDLIFKGIFTFTAVTSVGITITICLWVFWQRRVNRLASFKSVQGNSENCCITEKIIFQAEDNAIKLMIDDSMNLSSSRSLLHPNI